MSDDINLEELKRRLRQGDYLEISTGGGAYEVWAEPYASPPAVYYEGEQHPMAELDRIANKTWASCAAVRSAADGWKTTERKIGGARGSPEQKRQRRYQSV